jgi:hypothetical protein
LFNFVSLIYEVRSPLTYIEVVFDQEVERLDGREGQNVFEEDQTSDGEGDLAKISDGRGSLKKAEMDSKRNHVTVGAD